MICETQAGQLNWFTFKIWPINQSWMKHTRQKQQMHLQMFLWKQEISCLLDVERGKQTEDGENWSFKVLAIRFWFTSKRSSLFNKVIHGRPFHQMKVMKRYWYVTKSRLDVPFVKKDSVWNGQWSTMERRWSCSKSLMVFIFKFPFIWCLGMIYK